MDMFLIMYVCVEGGGGGELGETHKKEEGCDLEYKDKSELSTMQSKLILIYSEWRSDGVGLVAAHPARRNMEETSFQNHQPPGDRDGVVFNTPSSRTQHDDT